MNLGTLVGIFLLVVTLRCVLRECRLMNGGAVRSAYERKLQHEWVMWEAFGWEAFGHRVKHDPVIEIEWGGGRPVEVRAYRVARWPYAVELAKGLVAEWNNEK